MCFGVKQLMEIVSLGKTYTRKTRPPQKGTISKGNCHFPTFDVPGHVSFQGEKLSDS